MPLVCTARFTEAVSRLPQASEAKLPKALKLPAGDHRRPGFQSKKIHRIVNQAVYEARLDQAIRFTFQIRGEVLILRNIDRHDACLEKP